MASHSPKSLKWLFFVVTLIFGCQINSSAQSGTEFWLAPPDISDLHNVPGGEPLYLFVSSTGLASTVTVEQPANGSFTPIVVNVAANKTVRVNLTAFKDMLETTPTNTVLNTGLHITATTTITCYYECNNSNNTDIWALKGPNAEGTEFYIPHHKHAPFNNHQPFGAPDQAYASFDICATQNNTVVTIYSPTPVDGHPALQQFNVNLNRGQTYSCGWTGANWYDPTTHPAGAVVLANYPITVSLKDDSDHNPSGGCYDIIGDQITPVEVVGQDYIAVKGSLNNTGDESVVLMATQNNTQVFVDGSATPLATLFAGEYFRIDMDSLSTSTNNALYVHCSKPAYAMHITGFGCEMGSAQLPPLNCAGSQQLNFVRDDPQTFYITVLCRATAVNGFTMTGPGTATINPASFITVPGTGGEWTAAKFTYNATQVPVDSTFKITNSIDVFALGVGNGGSTSGCKYGYFSEFVAPIVVNAGINQTICANTTATLNGSVSGGTITGQWTTTGTGTFSPNDTALNAIYTPSSGDAAVGSIILTLTSTGACIPESDQMILTITPAPTANAGADESRCSNNPNTSLSGIVTVATGGVWTGGAGSYIPGNNVLNPVYVPTASEVSSGSVVLTLTTTGNGLCNPVSDNIVITFTPSPVVNAGPDQTKCGNNAATSLSGSITVASGAVWTGGGGSFVPSSTSLNPVYTPTPAEISAGSVTLILTTTGNLNCNAVSDQMTIFFSAPPIVSAGPDQIKCGNNAPTSLAGSVTGAGGGQWSGGLGVFSPNNIQPNATYTPTAGEVAAGLVVLTFTSTGNGTCNPVSDQMTITFTPAPTANAGVNQTVCANNPAITLNGSFTVATGAIWTGGGGSYSPNNTNMSAVYTPSAAEITAGSVTLTLTTTGNGSCLQVTDQVTINFTPSPIVNAGPNQSVCANNATVTLAGSVTTATGGIWSGGAGTYNPSTAALNAVYTPTPTEISNGSVTLTLTSTGNGGCVAVSDQVTISFTTAPSAFAGNDQVLCANNAVATLSGNVSVAGGGQWSGGLGFFLPNNNTLNATYTPTAGEIASGSINLILTTTSNGTCNAVTDQVNLSFTPAPTANAGIDQTVCSNNPAVTLNGSFTTATGISWSGGTGSFIPNNTATNAVYNPSPAEVSSGTITLTLTTTGNGTCATVSDQMVITITSGPVVNAGPNQTQCSNNPATSLSGSITVASGGIWSGGSGTYNPSATSLNAVYTPTATEISNGSVTLTLTSTGNGICNAVSDQVTIFYSSSPTANAGTDQVLCSNNAVATLSGSVTTAGGGQWSGGLGIFTPGNSVLNATYTPTAAEIASGSVNLILTTTSNGTCIAVTDQVNLSFTTAPTVSAGVDQSVCGNNPMVTLSGSSTVAGGVTWSGGSGSFVPNNTSHNTSYNPTPAEISAGSVTLTLTTTGNGNCIAVSDQVLITITPSPTVNAGTDMTLCSNNANASLSGIISVATGGTWSGGGGTFNPSSSSLNVTYTPTPQEISNGSVTLTLTSTGNGNCNAVSDNITIFFSSPPTANAGSDQTLCANNAVVNLAGNITTAGGGQWSGGLGLFSPNSTSLNTTYTPTASEIASGNLVLILTTTGNGGCNAVTDAMIVFFTPAPVVNASTDATVCANNSQVQLNGSVSIASGAAWTGGTGTYSPNNTTLNAVYTPSATEILNGTASLTLTSTGNGNCTPVSDVMAITITPSPIVEAGTNIISCVNNASVSLNGQVFNASGGVWSGGAGSYFPANNILNAVYTPSASELSAGSATLTLTSTGNGTCNPVTDQVTIIFSPSPIANAGSDQVLCSNNAVATLNGSFNFSTGIQWSGGLGLFSPSPTAPGATYTPTAGEIAAGSIDLILTTTGNGSCVAVSDTMHISYTAAPVVDAGAALSSCANAPQVSLNGSFSVSTGATWSGGSGTYSPGNTSMNATYTPSTSEITAGGLTLTLTSTGNGGCMPSSDQVAITIVPAPVVNAGNDVVTCINNLNVGLSGSVSGSTNSGIWSTSGTGTFVPNNTTLNATYQNSALDVSNGGVTLTLTSTANGTCLAVTDQMVITILPPGTASAGSDITVCANNATIALSGSVGGGASSGTWGTTGTGSFSPNNTSLNTTYTPSAFDAVNGEVTLYLVANSCNFASDSLHVTITPAPVVDAGSDEIMCTSEITISLDGSVSGGSSTGAWTSSGTGTFVPFNNILNPNYAPSGADISAGVVYLTLTSTGNGSCLPVSDVLELLITTSGSVNAGSDQTVCANNSNVILNGSLSGGATLAQWSSNGSGSFTPNNTTLNATYHPSVADIAFGSVTLTLNSTNSCNAATDAMTVTITPAPLIDAGAALTSCSNNPQVQLNGSFSNATGATWSGGSGTYSPGNSSMTAIYTPSAAEITSGSATLTLTSEGNGNCIAVTDVVAITIISAPIVNAGADQTTCVTDLNVAINGSVQGSTNTGTWTTSGTGTFSPSNTALNAVYQFSSADSIAGGVTLTLTSTNNQSCNAVADNTTIMIVPAGFAEAGANQMVCANNAEIDLNGTVGGGATSGTWTTSGTGTFTPDNTSLNTTYIPSVYDTTMGSVHLYLTANTCVSTMDSIVVDINPAPLVNAGADQTICESETTVQLAGSVSVSSVTGIWTTSGTGTFSPSATAMDAIYTPSAADVTAQNITITLTSTSNGDCLPVSDIMMLNIYPVGSSSAGSDVILCGNNGNVQLAGSIGGGATEGLWTTTGSGIFIPNNTALDALYVPNEGDIMAGGVILSLTATNSCNNAVDFLSVTYTPAPEVDAGPSQALCGSNPSIILNGTVDNAAGGIWTGGNGNYVPNNTNLIATYSPSTDEMDQGYVTLTLTSTGNGDCVAVSDTVTFYMTSGVVVNAGVDQQVCISSPNTQLQGIVSNGSTTGHWTTFGSGTFIPDADALNALYEFSPADISAGSVTLMLTSTNNGTCSAVTDLVSITFGQSVFVHAGSDQQICSSEPEIALSGFVTGGSSTGIWTSTGNGSYNPGSTHLDATYTITASDIAAGEITFTLTSTDNGSCLPGTDTLVYLIDPISVVSVGGDINACADEVSISIGGNVSGASNTGIWTTTGTGSFMPDNATLNAEYIPSPTDSLTGTLSIMLTATNTGSCIPDNDSLVVNLHPVPVVNAGSDQSVCSAEAEITLNGMFAGGASGITWASTGSGSFTPDANTVDAVYTLTAADINLGEVTFILSSIGQGACAMATDTVVCTINQSTILNAGGDQSICSDDLSVTLNGTITGGTTSIQWITMGSGDFIPDNTTLDATYIPSASDSLGGEVILILSSTITGLCPSPSDSMMVTINSPAIVDAGSDEEMCATDAIVNLQGTVSGGSTTGTWNSSGTGQFSPDASTLNAVYTPSVSDLTNGSVTITLTASGTGACPLAQDEIEITFVQPAIVNAGSDRVVCGENYEVELSGMITGPTTTGVWSTNGSGEFDPGIIDLNAIYIMSTADMSIGSVMIILNSTNNTICPAAADTMMINVEPAPVAAFSAVSGDELDVHFTDESLGATSWLWDFGLGGSSTSQNPSVTYPQEGNYDVTLIVYSDGGCSDTTMATVVALEPEGTPVAIPSGFSPNGDSSNDVLYVLGGPFLEVDFRIYNEWGNLIFSTTDAEIGWDGTYKGKMQPGGVYVYTATGITTKGRHVRLSGDVTLIH